MATRKLTPDEIRKLRLQTVIEQMKPDKFDFKARLDELREMNVPDQFIEDAAKLFEPFQEHVNQFAGQLPEEDQLLTMFALSHLYRKLFDDFWLPVLNEMLRLQKFDEEKGGQS